MTQSLQTFFEKIHILHGGHLYVLSLESNVIRDVAAVIEQKIMKTEQVINQHLATLPSPL